MVSLLQGFLVLASSIGVTVAQTVAANNATLPTSQYWTRPLSYAPVLDVQIGANLPTGEGFSNGLVFFAPYQSPGAGPYIYDKFGNLVADLFGLVGAASVHNFHVCNYDGGPHLCMHAGNQQEGYSIGHGVIVDSDYRIVKSIQTGGNLGSVDQHEFQITHDGSTALVTSYKAVPYDLSGAPYGVTQQQGWLLEGAFQEIDIDTGDVLFEWFSADHVNIADTRIAPHSFGQSGDGYTAHTAFDYFHINSVDKSGASQQYLISGRHVNTVYAINSTDQTIIWRLACPGSGLSAQSDFECDGFNFSSQHDARWVEEQDSTTIISIFDNGSNGVNATNTQSSGMLIQLDHNSNKATLLNQTFGPNGGILSASQGNTQRLDNGNVFHGWGSVSAMSELQPVGNGQYETVFYANWTDTAIAGTAMSYRAFSFDGWQSTPSQTKPAVYAYAYNTTSPSVIWVSWNGATTVATWNYWVPSDVNNLDSLWRKIGSTGKVGFETEWMASEYYLWVMVEAVGPDGTSLRNSSFTPTFSPGQGMVGACDLGGCLNSDTPWTA